MGGHNGQFWGIFWVGDFLTISNKQLNFSLFVTRVEDVEDILSKGIPGIPNFFESFYYDRNSSSLGL